MDSEVQRDGRVLDLTDDAWREDRLPYEDVTIPLVKLHIYSFDFRITYVKSNLRNDGEYC